MEQRRASTNSESSVEPMDISAKTTSSTEANSSPVMGHHLHHLHHKNTSDHNDSDTFESDDDRRKLMRHDPGDDFGNKQNIMRRDNLRLLDPNMLNMRKKLRHQLGAGGGIAKNNNNNIINNNNHMSSYDKFQSLASRYQLSLMAAGATAGADPSMLLDYHQQQQQQQSNSLASTTTTTTIDANENGSMLKTYNCPICDAVSMTQHEYTEHIRSHNNADDTQNFTCKICFKVSIFIGTCIGRCKLRARLGPR